VKACDDGCCIEVGCETADVMMLSQGAKHNQIWQHKSDFDDKATREFAWMCSRRMEAVIDGEDSRVADVVCGGTRWNTRHRKQ
jgi:hypothetical protein